LILFELKRFQGGAFGGKYRRVIFSFHFDIFRADSFLEAVCLAANFGAAGIAGLRAILVLSLAVL